MNKTFHVKKISIFLVFSLFCSLFLSGCSSYGTAQSTQNSNAKISKTGFFFSTDVSVTLYGTSDETILEDCFLVMKDYEKMLSKTIEGSDIWNINQSIGQPVEVSE